MSLRQDICLAHDQVYLPLELIEIPLELGEYLRGVDRTLGRVQTKFKEPRFATTSP